MKFVFSLENIGANDHGPRNFNFSLSSSNSLFFIYLKIKGRDNCIYKKPYIL